MNGSRRTTSEFSIVRRRSTARAFHSQPIPDEPRPALWVHEITEPALVLGSTQSIDVADADACARGGFDVVTRRSGGGAVLLVPGDVVWLDVILPTDGPGWSTDVHRPMVWIGEHLRGAFEDVGVADLSVHDAAMVNTAHSRLVCFDGVGPGELVRPDGSKLVGISQRRTRDAARLQCCWYSHHDAATLTGLLVDGPDPSGLRPVATVERASAVAVVDRLAARLGVSAA